MRRHAEGSPGSTRDPFRHGGLAGRRTPVSMPTAPSSTGGGYRAWDWWGNRGNGADSVRSGRTGRGNSDRMAPGTARRLWPYIANADRKIAPGVAAVTTARPCRRQTRVRSRQEGGGCLRTASGGGRAHRGRICPAGYRPAGGHVGTGIDRDRQAPSWCKAPWHGRHGRCSGDGRGRVPVEPRAFRPAVPPLHRACGRDNGRRSLGTIRLRACGCVQACFGIASCAHAAEPPHARMHRRCGDRGRETEMPCPAAGGRRDAPGAVAMQGLVLALQRSGYGADQAARKRDRRGAHSR